MIVFVAGMPRSGSTFTYAIVREGLLRTGTVTNLPAGTPDEVIAEPTTDHLILKAHAASPLLRGLVKLGAVPCIMSVRPIEDAAASWMETFGFDTGKTIDDMKKWIRMYQALKPYSLAIPYTQIESDPYRTAKVILQNIGADVSLSDELSSRYDKEGMYRRYAATTELDQDTFFHPKHVSSVEQRPAEHRIDEESLETIRAALESEIEFISEEIRSLGG